MKKILKLLGIVIILIFICLIGIGHNKEYPDEVYVKMTEINDNKTLIGLSEEEVVELLGEPNDKYIDIANKNIYVYFAGSTIKKSFFTGEYGQKVYELLIDFDATGKVESTYMKECP